MPQPTGPRADPSAPTAAAPRARARRNRANRLTPFLFMGPAAAVMALALFYPIGSMT